MRYLVKADEDKPFAYACGRRDFCLVADDTLWAHESHDWLVAAGTGALLAHRTRDRYYSVSGGRCLYRITSDPPSASDERATGSKTGPRVSQTRDRGANTRR